MPLETEPFQITTTLLLSRLHDSRDEGAWRLFDERFRGVIMATGLRLGLSRSDAEEVAQETMLCAVRDYQAGMYDRTRWRLSSWIVAIAHHRVVDLKRRRHRERTPGNDPGDPAPATTESDVDAAFELALEREIFEKAWEQVRSGSRMSESTLLAFELTALRGLAPGEASARCGISVEQVYVAKTRVTLRLRETVEKIDRAIRDGL